MIVDGRIKVTILGDDGREVILSVLGRGDFFGEMALLDNEPRSATAIAVEDTELLSLHRNDFQSVLTDNRSIMSALIKILTARLRRANHQISTLALLDVYGRVARVIVDTARDEGRAAEGRPHRLPPGHAPGDRQPHRHHPRDRHPDAEGPGAPGPDTHRRQGGRGPARLREDLRLADGTAARVALRAERVAWKQTPALRATLAASRSPEAPNPPARVAYVPGRVARKQTLDAPREPSRRYSRLSRWSLIRARTASSLVAARASSHISTAFRQNSCF